MKFIHHLSLVALFGSFAVAVPANFLSLTLSLKEGDAVTHERGVNLFGHDPCLAVCYPEKPNCALGWVSTHRVDWLLRSESELTNVCALKYALLAGEDPDVSQPSAFDM